jgi:signal transduction histidine kinase
MSSEQDTSFARLVSLAAHDLRTPLATVHGFARTIQRTAKLEPPLDRYVEMITAAAAQMTDLLETMSLAARIEGERYEPVLAETDTLALAEAAATDAEGVRVEGTGAAIETDKDAVQRALAALASCARRHGGFDEVTLRVDGTDVRLSPIGQAAPILLGEELRDLGSAVAVRTVSALGGSVEHADDAVLIRLRR